MFYEEVFDELNKRGVRYLVVGGVALVLTGVVRLTVDLDLMLDMSQKNLEKFVSAMTNLGYKPKMPVDATDLIDPENRDKWMQEKNMVVFSFIKSKESFAIVDVFIDEPIDFEKSYSKKNIVMADGLGIPLVSLDDLKKLKRMSGRSQDIADIKALDELEKLIKDKKNSTLS